MKWLQKEGVFGKNVPLLLLLAVGVIEFLFITLESRFSGISYYLAGNYVIVPCLLLLGYVLREKQNTFARRRLLLAVAAIAWFLITQCIHTLSGMENHPMATVFLVYLMAFPFAALADDCDNAGLRWIGGMFVAASLVLVFYTALLVLDMVPSDMKALLYWDGARLNALWHPNITASYLMIGIGFSVAFCCMVRKKRTKALLIAAIVLQMMAMALTNCRTTLLLTGAFLGGTLFFLICRGNWKRFLLGLLAAGVMLVGCFKLSGMLYQWNNERMVAELAATKVETVSVEEATNAVAVQKKDPTKKESSKKENKEKAVVMEETGVLLGGNEQHSLAQDMRTLNGRTHIWESALKAVRDSKPIMLWGTEYSGTVISVYNWFDVVHAHNSWMEVLLRMGVPGLLMSLVFTVLSAFSAAKLILSPGTVLWKKVIAMLAMCVMATGFLEPYLFITNVYYHVTDFVFFFLTGYLDFWSNRRQEI